VVQSWFGVESVAVQSKVKFTEVVENTKQMGPLKFKCQGSGNCCVTHGEFGFVFVSKTDRKRFADFFEMPMSAFTKKHCRRVGKFWALKDNPKSSECLFLVNKRCSAYSARPTQCRTWPFWPEVMNAKTWNKEVASFCPGVGKGKVVSQEKIIAQLKEQVISEQEIRQGS
jgi:Fe-S-cluster containining protein